METLRFSLKRHLSGTLFAIIFVVLALLLFWEHRAAQLSRLAQKESAERLIAAHGLLAAALEGDTLSLENQMMAAERCVTIQRELTCYKQDGLSETQLAGLTRFYSSVEHYLTKTISSRYPELPREEAIDLNAKDQSVVDFIRNSSQRVYDECRDQQIAVQSLPDNIYSAIGTEFEITFHSFDRDDFFRYGDPLERFFE